MALKIGIHTGPQDSSMDDLIKVWRRADEAGFYWISVWDHFYSNPLQDRHQSCFEGVAAMAALAAVTQRARVGCNMFCTMFRHPSLLAKSAITIDHISHGRCELGVGAGWFKEEFEEFGWAFPPAKERLDRLEEALTIIRSLFQDDSTTFHGKHFQVNGAVGGSPKPVQARLPIWVGGHGPKRTPRIAAQYADGFNVAYMDPETCAVRQQVIDRQCERFKRDPKGLRRAVNLGFYMGADKKGVERANQALKRIPESRWGGMLRGTSAEVIERLEKYERAGVDQVNVAFRPPVDWEAFEALIAEVLPHFHK
jgi:F420-dependent oxidoreductase-like protein